MLKSIYTLHAKGGRVLFCIVFCSVLLLAGVARHLAESYLAIAVQWSIYPAICLQAAAEQRSSVRIDALPFTHLALKWRTGTAAAATADADAAAVVAAVVGIAKTMMMIMMMMVMALAVIVCCCHFHVAVVVVIVAVLLRATVRF